MGEILEKLDTLDNKMLTLFDEIEVCKKEKRQLVRTHIPVLWTIRCVPSSPGSFIEPCVRGLFLTKERCEKELNGRKATGSAKQSRIITCSYHVMEKPIGRVADWELDQQLNKPVLLPYDYDGDV